MGFTTAMENWSAFRDPELAKRIVAEIKARVTRPVKIMEVCGTHTVAISRTGIRQSLEGYVELKSGPGCPVCVTDDTDIDGMIHLARQPGVIITTFGDMMRVPGSSSSLLEEKAQGADIRVVYSPLDAVQVAEENPGRQVIFLGVGFETTAPTITLALEETRRRRLDNFFLYSSHKLVPPALVALLEDAELGLDGFLLPGHVSAVLGRQAYDFIAQEYGCPAVIAGFEPVDILYAVSLLVKMVEDERPEVVNAYPRVVKEEGNPLAQERIREFFRPVTVRWRGLGEIPISGLELAETYADLNAVTRFLAGGRGFGYGGTEPGAKLRGCACGEVLKGKIDPDQCPLFDRVCTPTHPVGPCMVSSEGSCAAHYRYDRH